MKVVLLVDYCFVRLHINLLLEAVMFFVDGSVLPNR